jgi:hypothetical protein
MELRPEKIVVNTGLLLFALAAVLEGLSRLGHRPGLHNVAWWLAVAGLLVVLIPVALVAVILSCQALLARTKGHNGS